MRSISCVSLRRSETAPTLFLHVRRLKFGVIHFFLSMYDISIILASSSGKLLSKGLSSSVKNWKNFGFFASLCSSSTSSKSLNSSTSNSSYSDVPSSSSHMIPAWVSTRTLWLIGLSS